MTDGVQNLNVADQGVYGSGQSIDYGGHHATAVDQASYTHDARQPQEPSYLAPVHTQQQNAKGKGKSREVEHLEEYGNPSLNSHNLSQSTDGVQVTSTDYDQGTHPHCETRLFLVDMSRRLIILDGNSDYLGVETPVAGSSVNATEPHVNNYEPEEPQSFNDAEYREAIRRSRDEYYGTGKTGEPSYSTPLTDTATSSSWPTAIDPNAYELSQCLVKL